MVKTLHRHPRIVSAKFQLCRSKGSSGQSTIFGYFWPVLSEVSGIGHLLVLGHSPGDADSKNIMGLTCKLKVLREDI